MATPPHRIHGIVDTDHLADLDSLPKEIIVVGAGVVGLEYASFMAALGAEVTLIDQRPVFLDFVDRQIVEALCAPLSAILHFVPPCCVAGKVPPRWQWHVGAVS